MEAENISDWLKKCLTCKHAYKKKDEDDCIYCRCRFGECNYEAYEEKSDGKKEYYKVV